jgi:hypothetical protein
VSRLLQLWITALELSNKLTQQRAGSQPAAASGSRPRGKGSRADAEGVEFAAVITDVVAKPLYKKVFFDCTLIIFDCTLIIFDCTLIIFDCTHLVISDCTLIIGLLATFFYCTHN